MYCCYIRGKQELAYVTIVLPDEGQIQRKSLNPVCCVMFQSSIYDTQLPR